MLDTARLRYKELIEGVNGLLYQSKQQTGIPSLKLQYSKRRGYFLSMDPKEKLNDVARRTFIQITYQAKRMICSTQELNSFNSRISQTIDEIFVHQDSYVSY